MQVKHIGSTDTPKTKVSGTAFRLPPLILHPFSSAEDTAVLVESSRASLTLQGFLPQDTASRSDLDARLLRGRYAELRMLYYIGKDLNRWIEQCMETTGLAEAFAPRRVSGETVAVYLIENIPEAVRTKLEGWGVMDFCALFRRAIGLHSVFSDLPGADVFTPEFLRRYHRYLDQWYEHRLNDAAVERPKAHDFQFDLYASGEYTQMLEQSWGIPTPDGE